MLIFLVSFQTLTETSTRKRETEVQRFSGPFRCSRRYTRRRCWSKQQRCHGHECYRRIQENKYRGVLVKTANTVKRSSHPDQTWERGSDQRQRKNRINAKLSRVGTFVRYTTSDALKSTVNIEIRRKKTCVHVLHEGEGAEAWRRFVEHCGPQQASPWLGMPRQKLPFDVGDVGTRFETASRLVSKWLRRLVCFLNEIVTVTRGGCHMVRKVQLSRKRWTLRPSITLRGVVEHVIAQRFDALRAPYTALLSKRPCSVEAISGHEEFNDRGVLETVHVLRSLGLHLMDRFAFHLHHTTWNTLCCHLCLDFPTRAFLTASWRSGSCGRVSNTCFFFLRDEAFFPEWTAWSVMNVPRHVSAIRAFIFILFQFVIHMMRRVQPLVVVVTQGAHVKTSNGLGSRVLVVHRPPSSFHL